MFTEYQDLFYFKNDADEEKAFNLVQMTVFRPTHVDIRFIDTAMHGYLERMTANYGWRSLFSSGGGSKVTWVKYYFVLRTDGGEHTLSLYTKDNFDKAVEEIHLEAYAPLAREPVKKQKYNKDWVFELQRADESPICLAAENTEKF